MRKVVIVGGGITGLTAAHTLEEARKRGEDVDYILLEQSDRVGGVIRTDIVDGFIIDSGPDCFISHKPAVIQMADKLDFSDHLMGSNDGVRRTYVYTKGRIHKLPDGMLMMIPSKIMPFALSPLISWPGKARMLMDLVIPPKKDDTEETVAQFVTRRLGREALDKIAAPLMAGVHGCDPHKMSMNSQVSMLKMEKDHGSLIKAMLAAKKRPPGAPKDWKPGKVTYVGKAQVKQTFFMTFKNGLQEVVDRVAETVDSEKIKLNSKVSKIEKRPEGGYLVHAEGVEPIEADAVIVATLADAAAHLVGGFEPGLRELLDTIPNTASATVSLAYKNEDVPGKFDGFGMVIPSNENRKIMACTYSSLKWNHRVPDEDHVLVRAFVGGAHNPQYVGLEDKPMLDVVLSEMADIYGVTKKPILTRIQRWFDAMPQYNLGHTTRVAKIMELVDKHEGLYLAGGSYKGIGIPDCVRGGIEAAERALAHLREAALA